jgi:hypothetical protein
VWQLTKVTHNEHPRNQECVRHLQRWQKMLVQLIFALREFVHLQQLNKLGMLPPRANDLLVQMLRVVRKYEALQHREFGAS